MSRSHIPGSGTIEMDGGTDGGRHIPDSSGGKLRNKGGGDAGEAKEEGGDLRERRSEGRREGRLEEVGGQSRGGGPESISFPHPGDANRARCCESWACS